MQNIAILPGSVLRSPRLDTEAVTGWPLVAQTRSPESQPGVPRRARADLIDSGYHVGDVPVALCQVGRR